MKIIFYILIFLFIFSFNFSLPYDPDLGWHLRYGEEIIQNRTVPSNDKYSHTYTGEAVVNYEWITDAVFYSIYRKYSFFGLSLIIGLFTSLAFFIPILFIKSDYYLKFLFATWALLGSATVLKNGPRPQNISLVFFSILLIILLYYDKTKKSIILCFLPLLFLIWANAHPGNYMGLGLYLIFIFCDALLFIFRLIKKQPAINAGKKIISLMLLSFVFVICLISTNIKPQTNRSGGFSLELVKATMLPARMAADTTSSGKVRLTISEWLPPMFVDISGTLFLLATLFSIALFTVRPFYKKDFKNLVLLLIFIYFSTLSRRNTPFFFLIFIPIVSVYVQDIISKTNIKKKSFWLNRIALIIIFLVILKLIPSKINIFEKGATTSAYCKELHYPCRALEFLRNKNIKGNIFNHYNWGGYLIWYARDYPVFIDGRMPWGKVFSEYETVSQLKDGWEGILEKYNVTVIIYPKNELFETLINTDGKWPKIYEDEDAIVLVKKNT